MVTTRSGTQASASEKNAWAESAGAGDREHGAVWGISGTAGAMLALAGSLVIMILSPVALQILYVTNRDHDGSFLQFFSQVYDNGPMWIVGTFHPIWGSKAAEAWTWFVSFGVLQAALQVLVPGPAFHGPVSPRGNVPVYKANGIQCYIITAVLFAIGSQFGIFSPARLYDIFGELLSVANAFSLVLCALLTVKGIFMPSSSDCGRNSSILYDLWWGMHPNRTELYPRIGPIDVKTWTNCRMGMMSWTFITVCFAFKQFELYGYVSYSMLVSVTLSSLYCIKFFLWETGYWKTMDIAHDRAGYYLVWGCLNWVPGFYTSQPLYLTKHPVDLSATVAMAILIAGVLMIYINWEADDQRQRFRESDGQALVWGRKPEYIVAKYIAGNGEEKTSLLLLSGWWGVARHFHYVPEIMASVFWTIPALFTHAAPWSYSMFLTALLVDRITRDDTRCRSKYGKYWDKYCERVKYKMIPFIF